MLSEKPFFTSAGTENRLTWSQWFAYRRYFRRVCTACDELFHGGQGSLREAFGDFQQASVRGFKERRPPEVVAMVLVGSLVEIGLRSFTGPERRLGAVQLRELLEVGAVQTGAPAPPIAVYIRAFRVVEHWCAAERVSVEDGRTFVEALREVIDRASLDYP